MDISFQIKEAKLLECGEAKRPLQDTSAWLAALALVSESAPQLPHSAARICAAGAWEFDHSRLSLRCNIR